MAAAPKGRAAYIAAASPRYQAALAAVRRSVRAVFPEAKPVFAWGMPGWTIPRPPGAPRPARGTADPGHVFVGLVERKRGVTLHFWHPGDHELLKRHQRPLAKAGFKVMRGCVVCARDDFPAGPIEAVLKDVRDAGRGR